MGKVIWTTIITSIILSLTYVCSASYKIHSGWNDRTIEKMEYMKYNGIYEPVSIYIINRCKEGKAPGRCVQLATHAFIHEGARGTSYYSIAYHNPFGLLVSGGPMNFENRERAFDRWNQSFEKYRYNRDCTTMVTLSRYTTTGKPAWITNCYKISLSLN